MRVMWLSIVAVLLSGCAAEDYSQKPPDEVARHMVVASDEFSAANVYAAPAIPGEIDWAARYNARLIAVEDKTTGKTIDTLTLTWFYIDTRWKMFRAVTLPGARSLPVKVRDRQIIMCPGSGACNFKEEISAAIPREALESAVNDGLRLRVGTQRGHVDIELPSNYVAGYLLGVSRHQ